MTSSSYRWRLLQFAAALMGRRGEMARLSGSLAVDITPTRTQLGWSPRTSVNEGTRAHSGLVPCTEGTPMSIDVVLTAAGALLLTFALTALVRRLALAHGVLDVPNDRSSHRLPTPRGGGVAIVLSSIAASVVLLWRGLLDVHLFLALSGGIAVAFVGFLDDRRQLSARVRLAAHIAAAFWALLWLGGLPPMLFGGQSVSLGWLGYVVGALGIAWTVESLQLHGWYRRHCLLPGGRLHCLQRSVARALEQAIARSACAMALIFGAVCCGFLLWNWPPAKIFMGDVGSGYLGFILVVLAVGATRESPVALAVWVILGGVFFCDATVTLARRLGRGERVHEAHRSHGYQWLARHWGSHRCVTLAMTGVNLLWLLPCAWFASMHPGLAAWLVLIAYVLLVLIALLAGAGRRMRASE